MSGFIAWLAYGAAVLFLAWRLGRRDWLRSAWMGRAVLVLGAVLVLPLVLGALFLFIPLAYWVVMPAAAWQIGRALWRRTAGGGRWVALTGLGAACAWLAWAGGVNKLYYDWQVDRLCAKDGGIRVYETVKLPAEKFNKWGQVNFYKPTQKENALGPEYIFKWELHYFKKGNPSIHRSHTQVFRRSDGKLLGEAIDYSRGGGDLPGPWQPSSFTCPEGIGHIVFLTKLFIKSE